MEGSVLGEARRQGLWQGLGKSEGSIMRERVQEQEDERFKDFSSSIER